LEDIRLEVGQGGHPDTAPKGPTCSEGLTGRRRSTGRWAECLDSPVRRRGWGGGEGERGVGRDVLGSRENDLSTDGVHRWAPSVAGGHRYDPSVTICRCPLMGPMCADRRAVRRRVPGLPGRVCRSSLSTDAFSLLVDGRPLPGGFGESFGASGLA